jgi:hypothetical protein
LLAGENRLFEMIARGNSLTVILDGLCRFVEELSSGSLSSIYCWIRMATAFGTAQRPVSPKATRRQSTAALSALLRVRAARLLTAASR